MKIVVAPDSFKGSLTAIEACAAMQRAVQRVFPGAEIVPIPLADGGEGTLETLLQSAGGTLKTAVVRDAMGDSRAANWGYLPDGRAVIEVAQAAGLTQIEPGRRDALTASTYGVGQLINAALKIGCRQFLIGLGGSATSDGGAGALSSLGVRFRDSNEVILRPGGADLANLTTIDLSLLHHRAEKMSFTLLCDVQNPLCGENGAARIYAPQKGASPAEVEQLDAALSHFAALSAQKLGLDVSNEAGAGAAGGLAFGLMAYRGASVRSGIEVILEATDFEEKLRGADLVVTGEGALDSQTLSGKVIAGVSRAAKSQNVPVLAFAGKVELSRAQIDALDLHSAFSICPDSQELNFCLENAAKLLEEAVERVLSDWQR